MNAVNIRFSEEEIHMATGLLLLVTYYPDYPPLKSFANISFQGRKDIITLVQDGICLFVDIENCTSEQLQFFRDKIQEIPQFLGTTAVVENDLTRISILPAEAQGAN